MYGVYIAHIIIILKLVISWKDLSCWWKSYSNMTTLLLGWSHRYSNSTVVIMYWLTVTKYRHHELIDRYKISSSWTDWPLQNIVIMNWSTVTKYRHHELIDRYKNSISQMTMDLFPFTYNLSFLYWLLPSRLLLDLTIYMSNTAGVL